MGQYKSMQEDDRSWPGARLQVRAYFYKRDNNVRIKAFNTYPLICDKRFISVMHIWDNTYNHYRITREVWDAIKLYHQTAERDGAPFAGLTLNQFVRKFVAADRLKIKENK